MRNGAHQIRRSLDARRPRLAWSRHWCRRAFVTTALDTSRHSQRPIGSSTSSRRDGLYPELIVLFSLCSTDSVTMRPLMTVSARTLFSPICDVATTFHSYSSAPPSVPVGNSDMLRLRQSPKAFSERAASRPDETNPMITCTASGEVGSLAATAAGDSSTRYSRNEII